MLGLVLEGGGARGAYEIGAVRALFEKGYKFDGVVGTSIGAINAAVIAQGDWRLGAEIWEKLTPEQLFPGDTKLLQVLTKGILHPSDVPEALRDAFEVLHNGGFDISHIKSLLEEYIDEDKIRSSDMEFGLVTYSISDKKSRRLFKNDIPEGKLVDYLIASSMLPVFKNEKIDGKLFADGGYSDVCPYNMLIDRGYDELVIVRVFGTGVTRRVKNKDTCIQMIVPSDKLPPMLDFSPEATKSSAQMGYFDAIRVTNGYRGRKYYVHPQSEEFYFTRLCSLDEKYRRAIGKVLGLPKLPGMRLMFDGIIPLMASRLSLPENFTYEEFVLSVLESCALSKKIDRFKVYTFEALLDLVLSETYPNPDIKHTPITLPYRTSGGKESSFRLPSAASHSAYSYREPSNSALGTAIDLFVTALGQN